MSFKLEKKTYGWRYLLLLSFQCSPLYTVLAIGQKLVTGLVCVLLILLEAGLINQALSLHRGAASWQSLLPYLAGMTAMIVWKRMGYNLGRLCTVRVANTAEYQMREQVVKKCSRVPYRLLEDRTFQELKQKILNDTEGIIWTMLQQTGNFLNFMVRMSGVYLLLFLENAWLGSFILALTVPVVYFSVRNEQRSQEIFQQKKRYGVRVEYLNALLRGRQSVLERTLFSYTGYIKRKCEEWNEDFHKAHTEGVWQREGGAAVEAVVLNLVFTLAVMFQIALLASGELSIGMFIALSAGIYDTIGFMYHGIDYTIMAMVSSMYFLENLTAFAAMPETEGACELPSEQAEAFEELEFKKVAFRYPRTAQYILKDLSFRIKKGEHCAFVGENGAGKTTIAEVLTGVYDNYEGSILINGRELRDYAPEKRKAMLAAVYQDSARYDETVAVNIGLGDVRRLMHAEGQVEEAARQLGIYESMRKLPQGFDTALGKQAGGGIELSDGQWQRIIMARLLVSPAQLWILDEPAAALDPVAESSLYEQFGQISQGRTTISISHRLGSARQADRIYVLKNGTIVEEGSHEELMKRQGLYARMYEGQKEWYR